MIYVEITFPDGTIARWALTDDDSTGAMIAKLERILGDPDTLVC